MTIVCRSTAVWSRLLPTGQLLLLGWVGFCPAHSRAAVVLTAATPCTLAWDVAPDPAVAGYAVYYGLTGAASTNRLDVGATPRATIYHLPVVSNCFFYVVAYDANGVESSPSLTVFYRPVALSALHLAPQGDGSVNLQFRTAPGAIGRVQYSASLANPRWQTLATATADASGWITIVDPLAKHPAARFYRAVR